MPDFSTSARADAAGEATCLIQHNKSGLIWIVSQLAVESIPERSAARTFVYRNDRFLTSSSIVPASAQGKPFYRLNAGDKLEVRFDNLTSGDTAIVTVSYNEAEWGSTEAGDIV